VSTQVNAAKLKHRRGYIGFEVNQERPSMFLPKEGYTHPGNKDIGLRHLLLILAPVGPATGGALLPEGMLLMLKMEIET
jgi:hypothetical protein